MARLVIAPETPNMRRDEIDTGRSPRRERKLLAQFAPFAAERICGVDEQDATEMIEPAQRLEVALEVY